MNIWWAIFLPTANIVILGKIIEFGLKTGKIAHGLFMVANLEEYGFNHGRKEGEVHATSIYGSQVLPVPNNLYQQD